jgi:hypothetical protein
MADDKIKSKSCLRNIFPFRKNSIKQYSEKQPQPWLAKIGNRHDNNKKMFSPLQTAQMTEIHTFYILMLAMNGSRTMRANSKIERRAMEAIPPSLQ